MVNINLTKISSKGQIVIPSNMRGDLKEGDQLIIIKDEDRIILRKTETISEQMKEDLEFARRTNEAWDKYEKGQFKEMDFDNFINEMKKW
ncbi:AbrB family transcriptional regulator [Candidatus Pacearchaeota archaeon]|nr:AbrB family transcriptional regulator [Candidatus Pacearchaeota archaeon]|tara:strand:+ start:305 stop:574 length:270 start_codon:yes stop_codon:yes gene_type:complete